MCMYVHLYVRVCVLCDISSLGLVWFNLEADKVMHTFTTGFGFWSILYFSFYSLL